MEIISTFNLNDSDELAEALYPKIYNYIVNIAITLIIGFSIYNIVTTNVATAIIIVVITIIGILILKLFFSKQKNNFKQLVTTQFQKADYTDEKIIYHYLFNDDHMIVTNMINDGKIEIDYCDCTRFITTNHYLLVMTKANQYIIFDQENVNKNNIKEYIKQKNHSIKG